MNTLEANQELASYLYQMGIRNRLIVVKQDEQEIGWATFFILDTVEQAHLYHQRPMFSWLIDSPDGDVILIDKLVVKEWNRELRELFKSEIMSLYPHLKTSVWFRPSKTGPDHLIVRPIREDSNAANLFS